VRRQPKINLSDNAVVVVYDVDTVLSYPCPLHDYLAQSFPECKAWDGRYAPLFRVISAKCYIERFASDRSHMFNARTKEWNSPPPSYDCINVHGDQGSNFQHYINFKQNAIAAETQTGDDEREQNRTFGFIYTKEQFTDHFSHY
jgi:hypothetical protein